MTDRATTDMDSRIVVDAVRAGIEAILRLGSAAGLGVEHKSDESPVTLADRAAEAAITERLEAAFSIPIVAEERFSAGRVPETGARFFLVDPLDGTKSYIAGRPDYTVNIALIEDGVPVFGCVGVPETGVLYYGGLDVRPVREAGGEKTPLAVRKAGGTLDVVASRNHLGEETKTYLSRLPVGEMKSIGSSLKLCMLAEGGADLYPRFGRTMQWDIAAGDAVLRAAGGSIVRTDGSPFVYGRTHAPGEDIFANGNFIAVGDPEVLARPGILAGR